MKKDKKKIIRIIARLNVGGPAIHTILLSEAFDNELFSTHLVAGKPEPREGDMGYLAIEKNVKPVYFPELTRKIGLHDIKAFFKLFKLIKKEKPDIVHTHTAKAGALGRLAAFLAGVPVRIHTFHGHVFDGYFSPAKAKFFIMIEKFLGLFTTKTIVVSDCVWKEVVEDFKIVPPKKCVVIKLGFELNKFLQSSQHRGILRKKINVDNDTVLVGIVGRLAPIKNHEMFFNVASELLKDSGIPKLKFVVIGDGERAEHLKNYVTKKGLENAVIFCSWIKNIEKAYADLDIVALTSLNEGTPVSLIEAMASGRPVISTDVGGVRDIVRDGYNGLLTKSENVKEFSDKLKSLIMDREKRMKLGANGRIFASSTYNKERLVSDVKSLYESYFPQDFKV